MLKSPFKKVSLYIKFVSNKYRHSSSTLSFCPLLNWQSKISKQEIYKWLAFSTRHLSGRTLKGIKIENPL